MRWAGWCGGFYVPKPFKPDNKQLDTGGVIQNRREHVNYINIVTLFNIVFGSMFFIDFAGAGE